VAQRAVVANQHRGLGQQQGPEGVQVAVDVLLVPPGQVRHVGHHGQVGVVGGEGRHGRHVFRAAEEAGLDHLQLHVLGHQSGLLGDQGIVQPQKGGGFPAVAQPVAGADRQQVGAY